MELVIMSSMSRATSTPSWQAFANRPSVSDNTAVIYQATVSVTSSENKRIRRKYLKGLW